jgi:hypothetical protein
MWNEEEACMELRVWGFPHFAAVRGFSSLPYPSVRLVFLLACLSVDVSSTSILTFMLRDATTSEEQ